MKKIIKFNEMQKWDPILKKAYTVDNPLGTVGQLIEYLGRFNPETRVAVNVAEEPSEIFDIQERKVSECTGRGDGLEMTANWPAEDDVILIRGNQY